MKESLFDVKLGAVFGNYLVVDSKPLNIGKRSKLLITKDLKSNEK